MLQRIDIALTAINAAKDKKWGRVDSLMILLKSFDIEAYKETKSIIESMEH
jgi:hypothetical protein